MKIVRLTAENIKRLTAVEITPDGNTVLITGRNGQGKTSVLDSIWYALGGGPAKKDTARAVRDGQQEGWVELDLGDIIVTRTFHAHDGGETTSLRVENGEGLRYPSPQSLLDGLVGRLSFDPLDFARQPERKQVDILVELIDLPFDPVELDADRASIYEERTVVGRHVRQLEGQLAAFGDLPADLPAAEVPIADVVAALRDVEAAVRDRLGAEAVVDNWRKDVDSLEARLAHSRLQLENAERDLAELPLVLEADVDAAFRKVDATERLNDQIRRRAERDRIKAALDASREDYEGRTAQIGDLDEQKATAIGNAKMPLKGLGFDDAGVTYNGIPFKQCSSAEQLRVSLAIAMSLNPKIRVIRITDGSLLDAENLALIESMAKAKDFQVWVERVSEDGEVGIVIEDGAVKAAKS
jgi:hypothetical protein